MSLITVPLRSPRAAACSTNSPVSDRTPAAPFTGFILESETPDAVVEAIRRHRGTLERSYRTTAGDETWQFSDLPRRNGSSVMVPVPSHTHLHLVTGIMEGLLDELAIDALVPIWG